MIFSQYVLLKKTFDQDHIYRCVQVVWPVQELVAILGGVLGFWGGVGHSQNHDLMVSKVGSMGALFLLVLMTQRFFCRRREDKKEVTIITMTIMMTISKFQSFSKGW